MASPNKSTPASKRTQVVEAVKPWRKDAAWWILAIEAIVALGLGLYAVFVPESAGRLLTVVLGLFLLVDGAISLFGGLQQRGGKTFQMAASGISILAGLLVLLMQVFKFGDAITQAWIIAIAFILVGAFGLIAALFEFGSVRWLRVLVMLLVIALGGLYIYSLVAQNMQALTWTGWVLVAIGAMMGIYAAFAWNQQRKATAEVPMAASQDRAATAKPAPMIPPPAPKSVAQSGAAGSTPDATTSKAKGQNNNN